MPRERRIKSNSKIYHTIIKGIDSQDTFYDEQDRKYFLKQIMKVKKEFQNEIYSYCLMTNHIHMVIKCEEKNLSKSMQSLQIRYVHYFNKKYERTGNLFQNRFKSKCVENQKYFLDVCRYVHRNPEKAGMAKNEKYRWSSYQEYLGEEKIINKKLLLHYYNNNINEFIKDTIKLDDKVNEDAENYAEYEIVGRLSDEELRKIIMERFNIYDVNNFTKFFRNKGKEEVKQNIREIKNIKGTCKTQVSRVTGINRKMVGLIWAESDETEPVQNGKK